MPELPEVECLTRTIGAVLLGQRITGATFYRDDLRDPLPKDEFQNFFVGEVVSQISRRSKYMIWSTSHHCAIFHLGMTGNFFLEREKKPTKKHTHMVFAFSSEDGKENFLHYVDPRRFGRMSCCAGSDLSDHSFIKSLGPEPLVTRNLGAHLLQESKKHPNQPIKSFLMDASIVVGVGNIYASEALFAANIHPLRKARLLSFGEFNLLARRIKDILKSAIRSGGTSFRDYRHTNGESGRYQMGLKVYGRKSEPCFSCETPIDSARIGGRSSFFCPKCQDYKC